MASRALRAGFIISSLATLPTTRFAVGRRRYAEPIIGATTDAINMASPKNTAWTPAVLPAATG
jgi:hypothetical protein